MENGADKIRINPGNIQNEDDLIKIIEKAKETDTIIRIGVNSGSISDDYNIDESERIVNLALKYIVFLKNIILIKLSLVLKAPILLLL